MFLLELAIIVALIAIVILVAYAMDIRDEHLSKEDARLRIGK